MVNATYPANAIILLGSSLVALLFALWWLYFTIPFDTILANQRRRHDLFLFGYGHFFVFASLAGLGSALNLVADAVDTDVAKQAVLQPYAMGLLMAMLLAFLLTLTALRSLICRKSNHNILAMSIAAALIGFSYIAVVLGLPITYGVWLSILAPMVMIGYFTQDNKHWLA